MLETHGLELLQWRDGFVHVGVEDVPEDADGWLVRVLDLDGAGGGEDDVGHGVEDGGRELFVQHLAVVHHGSRGGRCRDVAELAQNAPFGVKEASAAMTSGNICLKGLK